MLQITPLLAVYGIQVAYSDNFCAAYKRSAYLCRVLVPASFSCRVLGHRPSSSCSFSVPCAVLANFSLLCTTATSAS